MRTKPKVNAILVENVATKSQEAKHAIVLELEQANGAFQAITLLLAEVLHGGIKEGGESFQKGRVEAPNGW